METEPAQPLSGDRGAILKKLAHDLGNLAYRLTFLTQNLKTQIATPGDRDEATALLEDTTTQMQRIVETLREAAKDD